MLASRRRLACRTCTRRKVKCDKQIPCGNCSKRGAPNECERDEVSGALSQNHDTPKAPLDGDAGTLSSLRGRIAELEAALGQRNAEASRLQPAETAIDEAADGARDSSSSDDCEVEDSATVLEFLAWGRMKAPDRARISPEALRATESDGPEGDTPSAVHVDDLLGNRQSILPWVQLLLPSRRQVTLLVDYHSTCLLWFHGSYFALEFSKQLKKFYDDHGGSVESPTLDLQWAALLFSILAGTMTSAPDDQIRSWKFDEKEARMLSQKWYKAVFSLLDAADYIAAYSVYSVQAIATLTSTAHILGHSNNQSVMLASATRIAQNLGLHRLDEDFRGSATEIETGRRLWEQLCTQDWFSVSFSETYSIHALHSTSLPPTNCDDDMNHLPEGTPTITSFCRFLASIAAIMPRLQDGMASSNTLYTKHEQVLLFDKKMRTLATEGRPQFLANVPIDESWPCWIPWARRAISMSSAHKIIMIHRKFLNLSFTSPVFVFSRRTCLAAAQTILKEYIAISEDDTSPTFWTHQAFSVAACIIICLDFLHQSSCTLETQHDLVSRAIAILAQSQKKSMIALRGVKLLTALQKEVSDAANNRKRPAETSEGDRNSRKRRRTFDMSKFMRTLYQVPAARPTGNNPSSIEDNFEEAMSQPATVADVEKPQMDEPDQSNSDFPEFNRYWDMPLLNFDGSQPFENLMFLASQDL